MFSAGEAGIKNAVFFTEKAEKRTRVFCRISRKKRTRVFQQVRQE
jgi:hypothetical protein